MENWYTFLGEVKEKKSENNTIILRHRRPVIHERHLYKANEWLEITCLDCANAMSNIEIGDIIEVHGCIDGNEKEYYFVIEYYRKGEKCGK